MSQTLTQERVDPQEHLCSLINLAIEMHEPVYPEDWKNMILHPDYTGIINPFKGTPRDFGISIYTRLPTGEFDGLLMDDIGIAPLRGKSSDPSSIIFELRYLPPFRPPFESMRNKEKYVFNAGTDPLDGSWLIGNFAMKHDLGQLGTFRMRKNPGDAGAWEDMYNRNLTRIDEHWMK